MWSCGSLIPLVGSLVPCIPMLVSNSSQVVSGGNQNSLQVLWAVASVVPMSQAVAQGCLWVSVQWRWNLGPFVTSDTFYGVKT